MDGSSLTHSLRFVAKEKDRLSEVVSNSRLRSSGRCAVPVTQPMVAQAVTTRRPFRDGARRTRERTSGANRARSRSIATGLVRGASAVAVRQLRADNAQ